MDGCSLLTLLACFSWSNVYVDGALQYQDLGEERTEIRTQINRLPGVTETVRTFEQTDAAQNPYGRFALGYQIEFRNVTFALEATHTSSLITNSDRGVNALSLRARWYPFR